MVISIESQNVKERRGSSGTFQLPKILNNIDFSFNKMLIPYILGLFLYSLIFANGVFLIIPYNRKTSDISLVKLPYNEADVSVRDEISKYNLSIIDSYYNIRKKYPGDTLSSLAIKYGVSKESILNINYITDVLKFDQLKEIKIPVTNGFLHHISSKDTLETLSSLYNVPVKDIFRINGLKSESITELEEIFIPGISIDSVNIKSNLYKYFVYPVNGFIGKRYGLHTNSITGLTSLYEGVDFYTNGDNSIFASKEGVVSRIGYSPSYGNYIYIDHPGGARSLYAHLESVNVRLRDKVKQGRVIGTIGNSGFTSTKKLFFCIFIKDESVDPEKFLK